MDHGVELLWVKGWGMKAVVVVAMPLRVEDGWIRKAVVVVAMPLRVEDGWIRKGMGGWVIS